MARFDVQVAFAMEKACVVDMPQAHALVYAGLGWDASSGDMDLDVSAVVLRGQEVLGAVFFGHLEAGAVSVASNTRQGWALKHSGDNLTGEALRRR